MNNEAMKCNSNIVDRARKYLSNSPHLLNEVAAYLRVSQEETKDFLKCIKEATRSIDGLWMLE